MAGLDGNINAGGSCGIYTCDDVFLTKWNADGTKAWTKQWGSTQNENGSSVAVDGTGNIYVAGDTDGGLDGNTNAGNNDIFLTKWNANGTKAWTKQWGTSSEEYGTSVAIGGSGNIFVTGYTQGGLDGNSNAGDYDIFLTMWSGAGVKMLTKQWGTASGDYGYSVVVDGWENIYVAGSAESGLDGNISAGGSDIFLTKWY
jgi:hypothetical protein